MREGEIKPSLQKILRKLSKKNPVAYEAILKKIEEILSCKDPDHYKNLRTPLQQFKRVHVHSSFVLRFKHVKETDTIEFHDFDHHDNIYK